MNDDPLHPSPEDLFAYRDGELSHEKRAIIEAHVVGCSNCRSLMDEVSSLEADLRRTPEGAPADYFERLPGTVRERIAREAPLKEAPARPPRAERRRADDSKGVGGSVGAAPKLPWAAVISTASAAAAVVVVVLILIDRGAFRRAVSPLPPPAAVSEPPAAEYSPPPSADGIDLSAAADSAAGLAAADRMAGTKVLGKDELAVRANEEAKLKKDQGARQMAALEAPAPPAGSIGSSTAAPPQVAATRARVSAENLASMPEKSSAVVDNKEATRGDYDSTVRALGLPPVWDERVSAETLRRAEPQLRLMYQTGRAGSDSARVRLYLAEAARLRYAPGDSTLFEQIVHHYLRAIRLAGPGSDIARVAAARLQTLER